MTIDVLDGDLNAQPVRWREAPGAEGRSPVLWMHGVPNSGAMWQPFLERSGGIAPDLPGFGCSGKRADLAYDIPFYAEWIERFLDWRGIERVRMCVHDWGAVGLAFAQRAPERVERLVVFNAVPLLPGYRWHRIARLWRAPLIGEMVMGLMNRRGARHVLADAFTTPVPESFLDDILEHFDNGTQRAILRLYRSSDPDVLAAAGARLDTIGIPTLVLWGEQDPFISPDFASAYARALGGEADVLADAGHWPWIDEPSLVGRATAFLDG